MIARLAPYFARASDSDLWHSFKRSPGAIISAVVTLIIVLGALAAPSWRRTTRSTWRR